jgi:hypothetical protein
MHPLPGNDDKGENKGLCAIEAYLVAPLCGVTHLSTLCAGQP